MHIVLVEPEIPGNTGNISRLCAAEHLVLHLVEPLGFSIDDKHLKRAGLDYWDLLEVHVHPDFDSVKRMLAGHHFYYNTTKAIKTYSDISYTEDDVLVFGKETKGLPEELLLEHEEDCIRIPHDRRSTVSQSVECSRDRRHGSTPADGFPPSLEEEWTFIQRRKQS